MPFIRINTSLKKEQIPDAVVAKLSKGFSQILERPEQFINIVINADQILSLGGNGAGPAADVIITHMFENSSERNERLAEKITVLLAENLKLPRTGFYVCIQSIKRPEIIYDGHTAQTLLEMWQAKQKSKL